MIAPQVVPSTMIGAPTPDRRPPPGRSAENGPVPIRIAVDSARTAGAGHQCHHTWVVERPLASHIEGRCAPAGDLGCHGVRIEADHVDRSIVPFAASSSIVV